MGVNRQKLKNHARNRPKKSGTDRRRRQRNHRDRLVALGVSEETVAKMNPKQVREKLKRPARTASAAKA